MTLMDATFSYMSPPRESEMRALDHVREVYGMRQLAFDEVGELVTIRVDVTGQCLAGHPIGGEKQYFLTGNAFQVGT